MAFKPMQQNTKSTTKSFDPNRKYPEPKAGSRPARVSLIVDLGVQNRPDFEDENGETRPQKPAQQVAVFADLTSDVVDYGGEIGKQPYRICLNKSYKGEVEGINFTFVPPRDGDGNMIEGKPWTLHPANLLSKLAKAVGKPEVIESGDIEQLGDLPFMASVEVKKTESKDKKDDEGKPVVFTNVNYKGATEVPLMPDDSPYPVPALSNPFRCVTFDNAKEDDIKFIRQSFIAKIKLANNYAGSAMQKAIEAYEANKPTSAPQEQKEEKATPVQKKPKPSPKPAVENIDSDDEPF